MGGALVHNKSEIRRIAERKRAWEERKRSDTSHKARKPRKALVTGRIPEDFLRKAYLKDKKSMREIAEDCSCSTHKVAYWIVAYSIPVRNQSEAVYQANNRTGDPFSLDKKEFDIKSISFLAGLGVGICQASGVTKNNFMQVASDNPKVMRSLIHFLCVVCGVQKDSLRLGLRVTKDEDIEKALAFWVSVLSISKTQFQKPIIIKLSKKNAYKNTRSYGSVTLYFYNSKLKQAIGEIFDGCQQ